MTQSSSPLHADTFDTQKRATFRALLIPDQHREGLVQEAISPPRDVQKSSCLDPLRSTLDAGSVLTFPRRVTSNVQDVPMFTLPHS